MEIELSRIEEITGARALVAGADPSRLVCGLSWDSRAIERDWLYAALVGERVDGHDFVAAAVRAGAACALVSCEPDEAAMDAARGAGCAILQVADVTCAIADLAHAWRQALSARVIGITGSVGKTTTKALVRDVLSARFRTCATKGNRNNELGAPATVLSAEGTCEMLVVEMGMDAPGQIADICAYARPDMGVITNVGVSHLEFLKTRDAIARTKAELFEALPEGGTAFVNVENDKSDYVCEYARLDARDIAVVGFGGTCPPEAYGEATWRGGDAVWAEDVSIDSESHPSFTLCARGFGAPEVQRERCTLILRGAHNVGNACAAAAVGLACGIELSCVVRALAASQPEEGRVQLKRARCGAMVFDDSYNASPESGRAALQTLSAYEASGRRIAVLGDMGELGSASERGHAEVGQAAAAAGLDWLICVGERSRATACAAEEAGFARANIDEVADAEAALALLDSRLRAGDVVLVKASHFMGLERVVGGIVE